MKSVRHILEGKENQVLSVRADATLLDVLEQLEEKKMGALVVMEGDTPVGIVSERNYARKAILENKPSHTTRIREIMSPELVFVRPDNTVDECMSLIAANRVKHLPVLDKNKLVGIVTIGDLLRTIVAEQQDTISSLKDYILGKYV